MTFVGSKKVYAKKIIEDIKQDCQKDEIVWVEPFVGGNNLVPEIINYFRPLEVILNDINQHQIFLLALCSKKDYNLHDIIYDYFDNNKYWSQIMDLICDVSCSENYTEFLEKESSNISPRFNKDNFGELLKDADLARWKKILLVSIFGLNGLTFFKGWDKKTSFTLDYGEDGYKKVKSHIKSFNKWLNKVWYLNSYLKEIRKKEIKYFNFDYSLIINSAINEAQKNTFKNFVIYLDPPYFEEDNIHFYRNDIDKEEFLTLINKAAKLKNVFVYLSEGSLIQDDRLVIINETECQSLFLNKETHKRRTEYLYKVRGI